jgi:hypothetical protein
VVSRRCLNRRELERSYANGLRADTISLLKHVLRKYLKANRMSRCSLRGNNAHQSSHETLLTTSTRGHIAFFVARPRAVVLLNGAQY